jgi:hypothetical protein
MTTTLELVELCRLYELDSMSPKAMAFLADLHELCARHGICIASSMYDGLIISDLTDKCIWFAGIEDCTKDEYAE